MLFYWHPQNQRWGAFENNEDPVGYTLFKGQPSHPFDWNRWRTDQEYYHWWQQQLGPDPYPAPVPAPAPDPAPAPVAVQALQFSAPTASEGGYMTITARLTNTVIGRARYSSQEGNIPGGGSGIELSEVFVEPEYRSRGYSTLILKHALQCIGFEKKSGLMLKPRLNMVFIKQN